MKEFSSVGERLKEIRESKKIKQETVAEYLNLRRQTYSSYETNGSSPNIESLKKLAKYYGVSSDFIIGLTEQQNPTEVYTASNIQGSNFVQGSGSVTVSDNDALSKEESEILRIYRSIDVRNRAKLLNYAFELEDELNQKVKPEQGD